MRSHYGPLAAHCGTGFQPVLKRARTVRRGVSAALMVLHSILFSPGCSTKLPQVTDVWDAVSGWEGDFDAAERRAYRQDRPLLIYYTKAEPWEKDPMLATLKSADLRDQTGEFTKCLLMPSHEPNRRYVNQFGVDRAPAIIIIHRDGTCACVQGPKSDEEVRAFLDGAKPPGQPPVYNPHVPRPVRYSWVSSLDSATDAAKSRSVPVFVVLDRPLTLDWQRLAPMLERREVFSRVAGMVHCRPGIWGLGVGDAQRRFGVDDLPAIIIVQPDDSYEALELPNSYEAIARFADAAKTDHP
jgi:hypothetical protein